MNIKDAKSIPLDEFLQRQGYTGKLKAGRLWYSVRQESTPSFVLTKDRFAWFDHGTGRGGNIINWPIEYRGVRDVSASLGYIQQVMGPGYVSQPVRMEYKPMEPELPYYTLISFDEFEPFSRHELTAHAKQLASRGIDPVKVAPYLYQVKFHHQDDPKKTVYHGFGMRNESDGFEVRANLFGTGYKKTTVGAKDVTIVQARNSDHKTEDWHTRPWKAFYSIMDFLTFITIDRAPAGTYNFIVIHGDAMIGKAAEYLHDMPPGHMEHYMHMDASGNGQRAALDLMGELPSWGGGDMAYQYEGFKDLNAWHMHQLGIDYRPNAIRPKPATRYNPRLKP